MFLCLAAYSFQECFHPTSGPARRVFHILLLPPLPHSFLIHFPSTPAALTAKVGRGEVREAFPHSPTWPAEKRQSAHRRCGEGTLLRPLVKFLAGWEVSPVMSEEQFSCHRSTHKTSFDVCALLRAKVWQRVQAPPSPGPEPSNQRPRSAQRSTGAIPPDRRNFDPGHVLSAGAGRSMSPNLPFTLSVVLTLSRGSLFGLGIIYKRAPGRRLGGRCFLWRAPATVLSVISRVIVALWLLL
ncbi:hypothetical protein MTO96_022217 [Rhipicephalus appendiculatus]